VGVGRLRGGPVWDTVAERQPRILLVDLCGDAAYVERRSVLASS
jgi:hypothetical protein